MPVRIGILGMASIADRYILPALQEMPETYSVEGIASRSLDKASSVAQRYGTRAFGDYNALLNRDIIDAVYIPLPNALHEEWVEKSLDQGLHVLVEKSLSCSYPVTKRLVDKARKKNLLLVENFQFRFHSQLGTLMQLVSSGEIGEIRCIRSSFGFPPFPDRTNIRYQPSLGGGALLDCGAYPIKMTQLLLGTSVCVKAATRVMDPNYGVDIAGAAFLVTDSGITSQIAFGFDHYYQCNVEIWGSMGKLRADRIFTAPPGFQPRLWIETAAASREIVLPSDHHFRNMLAYFAAILSQGTCETENLQNLNQSRLIEEVKIHSNE